MNLLKAFNDLLHVIASDVLLQPSSFAQDDEEISLVRWEHKVGVYQVFELDFVSVQTLNHILMLDLVEHLLLVFSFIYLRVKFLVKLHYHLLRGRLFACLISTDNKKS